MSIDDAECVCETIDQPLLTVKVVHRKNTVGLKVIACLLKCLEGKEITFEAQRRLAGNEREGVGQREQDEIVTLLCALQEGATVVDVHIDARVLVRGIRMHLLTDLLDTGINLDRVHVGRPLSERESHIVSSSR